MANKRLFRSKKPKALVRQGTPVLNNAGGMAFARSAEQCLAQYAVTGCFGNTFYVHAEEQLLTIGSVAAQCSSEFIAQCAVYARKHGHMKDMPAYLMALLAARAKEWSVALADHGAPLRGLTARNLFKQFFPVVIDNAKMLSTFTQIMRSNTVGRRALGSYMIRGCIQRWLDERSPTELFRSSVGNTPSLADVIRLTRPNPGKSQPFGGAPTAVARREATYRYLIGKPEREGSPTRLPDTIVEYENWKRAIQLGIDSRVPEGLPFQMIDGVATSSAIWKAVARTAPWQMTRKNLNTFQRHGVFEDLEMVQLIAARLRDPEAIMRSRVMPYQLFSAYKHADGVPNEIALALHDAMAIALQNTPRFPGHIVVAIDVSASMSQPITGRQGKADSKVRCVDVASVFACALAATSEYVDVCAFDAPGTWSSAGPSPGLYLFPNFSAQMRRGHGVLGMAEQLASFGGGGTDCSIPLRNLNRGNRSADVVIYISDFESWRDVSGGMAVEWAEYRRHKPHAKLVCIDLTPTLTAPTRNDPSVLHVGGFTDAVFPMIAAFLENNSPDSFVETIKALTPL